MRCNENLGK